MNYIKSLFLRIWVSCFFAIFVVTGCGFAAQPVTVVDGNAAIAAVNTDSNIEVIRQLICQGKFADAGKLIAQDTSGGRLKELSVIVRQYELMQARREAAREAKFKEQLAELEKLKVAADGNDANGTKSLTIVTMACEFASEAQKKELLSQPFVRQTIEKSIAKADEMESKGKWLDVYINCYSLLAVIEQDNRRYSDHAEKLLEKANIAASFQNSPCETSGERFEGVSESLFIKAVGVLNYNYVNPIGYQDMVYASLKRCQLLAEVMDKASDDAVSSFGKPFAVPERNKLGLFSSGLAAIANDMAKSMAGVSEDKFVDIFDKVLELNATTAKLPKAVVISQFAEASLEALDPYTVIVWPKQKQDFEKAMTNEFSGIGVEITKEKGVLAIASLLPDTPAYNSGLDAGDVIEKVNGTATKDLSIMCAVHMIMGPPGTKVTLTIKRPGQEQTQDVTLTRAKITVPTLRGWTRSNGKWQYVIDEQNKIGYVRLTNFSERTSSDFEKILNQLESQGMKGLILDLRFNSGGYLNSAVDISDKFLDKGTIVITRPRFWVSSTYASAHKSGTHPNYPLVVLVNKFSASASEIVAGALADKVHKRAILVGERTHGKGSVQGIATFPEGDAQLKYTMAYYYLPSGQRVESQDAMKKQGRKDWGVGPDVEVILNAEELKDMMDVQRDNDVLVKADHDSGSTPLKKHTLEETLASDPQLETGILVIKTKLTEADAAKSMQGSEK